jgi:hypothetical protein
MATLEAMQFREQVLLRIVFIALASSARDGYLGNEKPLRHALQKSTRCGVLS